MNLEKYSERVRGFIQSAQTMALSAALVFIVGAVVALLGPERRGVTFGRGAA